MNDMNLSGVTKDDFIEFVAATFFRVEAVLSVLYALQGVVFSIVQYRTEESVRSSGSSAARESFHQQSVLSATHQISSVVMALALFFLAVPLARLIRRSLSHAWETKPSGA